MAVACAIAIAAAALFLFPFPSVLALRVEKTGRTVFCAPVAEGEEFVLSYLHSVNRRPVYDTLRVEGKGFRIVKSRFDAFGAGMPEVSTGTNPLRVGPDGWLEYTVNRPVPDVTVFVGRIAQHTLHLRGRTIALADLAQPGTAIHFIVTTDSFFERWKGGCVW